MKGRGVLHIETRGAVINVRDNLLTADGKEVDSVVITPDSGWEIVLPDNSVNL